MQDSSRKHASYETGYMIQFPPCSKHRGRPNHSPENASSWKRGPGWCHTDSPRSSADMAHLPHSSRSEQGCNTKTFSIYSPQRLWFDIIIFPFRVSWRQKQGWNGIKNSQYDNPISTIRACDETTFLFIKQTSSRLFSVRELKK